MACDQVSRKLSQKVRIVSGINTKLKMVGFAAWATLLLVGAWALPVSAQVPGDHIIYGLTGPTYSTAYIDASVLPGTDICAQINYALTHNFPAGGGVVDARGINSTSSRFSLKCASGTPWGGGSNTTVNTPSTILLPAGTIQISNTWILPNSTAIVGEGSDLTTIQAQSLSVNPIIQMGSASPVCPNSVCNAISIEDLTLSGSGFAVSGIVNSNSQELSYVKHVNLYQILGTGLQLLSQASSSAQNSGPYTDINFDTQNQSAATTVCAQILGVAPTRGIHGLTCTSNGTPSAAVLLDSSGTSIEDVRIQGFHDGILVGANAAARSDVLLNVLGGKSVTNVIHVANVAGLGVTDLSLVAIGNGGGAVNTIQDDETTTTLSDATVGIYALGEAMTAGGQVIGFSRFTTSTNANAVTWSVGTASIPGNTACATKGSLYSNTGGIVGGQNTWYVCTGNGASNAWVDIE
jgi:hypothetical protein